MQAVLRNEFFTLTVDTLGAEAVSLKNAAGEEVLWQADPEVWPRHAPILFPWTGELPQSSYSHKGKTYHVVKQGFARDVEHTLVRVDEHEIVMELRSSPELKETWFPFEFVLTSMFRLEGKTIHHTLTVENPGQEELRFGIGFHPAFNIPFDDCHTTEDYEFRFDQPESPVIIDARPHGLLSGRCYYQWKNTEKIQLTDELFSNDSFCMAGLRTKTLGIYEKDTGRHIVCNVEGFPYKLIWSALAKPVRFVCIEPWHSLPSAENDPQEWNERAAAVCLAPGFRQLWSDKVPTQENPGQQAFACCPGFCAYREERFYSDRRALTGLLLAAPMAGMRPARMVRRVASTMRNAAASSGRMAVRVSLPETCRMSMLPGMSRISLSTMPMTPEHRPMMNVSALNTSETFILEAPMARRMPISFRRSSTLI